MRRFLPAIVPVIVALSFALVLTLNVSATTWSPAFSVKNPARRPAVAIDSNGDMYFVWANPDKHLIQYRHCAATNNCDPVEKLPKLSGNATAPAIALNSLHKPTVVWEQHKGKQSTIQLSSRGDTGWSAAVLVSDQPKSVAPAIAIDSTDMSHIVFESLHGGSTGIYYITQSAEFQTSIPILLDEQNTTGSIQVSSGLNTHVAVDSNNHAHVVWNVVSKPFGIKYTYQDNTGTFVKAITVATGERDKAPDISIDPNANLVGIVWETRKNNHAAFALWQNGTELFHQKSVEGGFDTVRHPQIAADCGGRFHIVFQRQKSSKSDWNIYYRQFNSSDKSFSDVTRLTDSLKDDAFPAIAASRVGVLGYITGGGGMLNGKRGEINGLCHGDPTPTPTVSPTIPSSGWEHIPNTDPRIVYTNTWNTVDDSNASDGDYSRCETNGVCKKGSAAEIDFTGGTRFEWQTAYANTYGRVDILIDGQEFERVDLCTFNHKSSTPKFDVRTYILTGDATTAHTFQIKFVGAAGCTKGNKNYVSIDGFNILR